MCREQRETKEKSFINIAPIGWRLVHSQVGCIQSAGAKGRLKKKKTHTATSLELVLVEPAVQPQTDSNKRCRLGPMTHSPLFRSFDSTVFRPPPSPRQPLFWCRRPEGCFSPTAEQGAHSCTCVDFSLVGSLKSDFAPSCAGTTHVPARRSGAGVPPYHVCRAIRVTNRPHVGEKSHARARAPVRPSGALQRGLFAMCCVCNVRE